MIRSMGILAAAFLCIATGCTSVNKTPKQAAVNVDPNAPVCLVELRASIGKAKHQKMQIVGKMVLQDVIDKVQAKKRFGNMKLVVYRRSTNNLGYIRMKAGYKAGRVDPLGNFAIHSGDRVVIIQDSATPLDGLLDSITGPLGSL